MFLSSVSLAYTFVRAKEIDTKYGKTFILTTDKGDKFFANKKICNFIKRNYTTEELQPNLIVETGLYRTFEKDGKQITYLNMEIRA